MKQTNIEDVERVVTEISTQIERIGHEVSSPTSIETDAGNPGIAVSCNPNGIGYKVLGAVGSQSIQFRTGFDAAKQSIIQRRMTDGGVQAASASQFNIGQSDYQQAQQELRERIDDDEVERIRHELVNRVSKSDLGVDLMTEDTFTWGFVITGRLYPYDEEISIQQLDSTIQELTNRRWAGQEYLQDVYDLRQPESDSDGIESGSGFY